MEQKLKVAVIGCGGISGCHLEAYSKNPNVEIYAAGHADDNSFHVGHASCSQSGSSRFSTCCSTCRAISSTGWSPLTTIKRCRSLLINSS